MWYKWKLHIGKGVLYFSYNFRRISAHAIKVWLDKIKTDDVPVLVCLTHADNLYLECVLKEDEYNTKDIEFKKLAIETELKVSGITC